MKRKRETVEQEMERLHSERTRLRTMRQKKQALETEGEKDTRMCSERERLVNFRRQQEVKETEVETHQRRCSDRLRITTSRTEERKMAVNKDDDKDHIKSAMKEGLEELHRTKDVSNPLRHRVHVCIVCDAVIIGTESINRLNKTGLEGAQSTIR